jgi:hypothetical protein
MVRASAIRAQRYEGRAILAILPAMKWVFRILGTLVLLMVVLMLLNPSDSPKNGKDARDTVVTPAEDGRREGLNRNASAVIYTKHARCRMGCRYISETEVLDILHKGVVNFQKSELRGSPDPKYAVEGKTDDGQEVRIVFAQSPRGVVVVTVIDLGKEWQCDCK